MKTLCIDIGSTFTKLLSVDDSGHIELRRIRTRLGAGAWEKDLRSQAAEVAGPERVFLSSSAGGGLKVAALGLTEEFTAEAARLAALGAGSAVSAVISGGLTRRDAQSLHDGEPDIVLLTGGVDGGDRVTLERSAARLAEVGVTCPVIVAGNRFAGDEAAALLEAGGVSAIVVSNVMPRLGVLALEEAREAIRTVFLDQIVARKALGPLTDLSVHEIAPTPRAVMDALAFAAEHDVRFHNSMVVDVGGATVDVHSHTPQRSTDGEVQVGLAPPTLSRTVEGDLGLKWGAPSVLAQASGTSAPDSDLTARAKRLTDDFGVLPDGALASLLTETALRVAIERHCGMPEQRLTSLGLGLVFTGKDCRRVQTIVGTGGPFVVEGGDATRALHRLSHSTDRLAPREATVYIDRTYGLIAVGLLAESQPERALVLLHHVLERAI